MAVAFVLVFLILSPSNQWNFFPVHHDDFTNLTVTSWADAFRRLASSPLRPVSQFAIGVLSMAGMTAFSVALHFLTLVYTWLALRCTLRILTAGRIPLAIVLAAALMSFSIEHTIEWLKYTGLVTNQLAGVLGLTCVALLLGREQRALGGKLRAGLWVLAAASFWSKEDFVVPVLLTAAYLAFLAWRTQRPLLRDRLLLLLGLVCVALLVALYNRLLDSTFLHASTGTYASDFRPASILRTAWAYLTSSPSRYFVLGLQAAAISWNYVAGRPWPWHRVVFWQLLIASLLLPYACLPRHTADYYGSNWFAVQAAGAVVLLWQLKPRFATASFAAAFTAVLVVLSYAPRYHMAAWYANRGNVNRNIVRFLAAQREALAPYPRLLVEGAPPQGPWFGADGGFLANRYGLRHEWLILVQEGSDYQARNATLRDALGVRREGQIRHLLAGRDPVPPGVPRIRINPDGTGTVELPPR